MHRRETVLFAAAWVVAAALLVHLYAGWGRPSESVLTSLWQLTAGDLAPTFSSLAGRASVIDGDTIEIRSQRIRLWGIDAPESRQLCMADDKPWRCGQRSALALADWLGQRTVGCEERDRDRYQRIVAKCTVGGEDIATWLVSHGWALDWPRYSRGAHASSQAEATSARRGVWQGDFEKPWEWRRRQRGTGS